MPSESQQQRKWAFGAKGTRWARAHHFDNPGKLPKRAGKKKSAKKKSAGKKTTKKRTRKTTTRRRKR